MRWQKDDLDGNLNFYSISSDGRVVGWTIVKVSLINKTPSALQSPLNQYVLISIERSDVYGCGSVKTREVGDWTGWRSSIDISGWEKEASWRTDSNGSIFSIVGCGTCFDFNKHQDYLFIVGTEEGKIHKCSKSYSNQFLDTFDAHHMAVYSVRWNTFHPKIFISCSADWAVKIWDINFK